MPPRKPSASLENNKTVASILLHTDPSWDSSPIRMPGWFALLLKDIPKENPAYDALLKFGYVASSRGVACFSAEHAAALEDNTFGPFAYTDPSPIDPSAVPSVVAKAGCILHTPAAAAAAAAAASAPAAAAAPVAHIVASRYKEAPEEITTLDLELQQWILTRISNETVREDFATKSSGSGRKLLRELSLKRDKCLSSKAASSLVNALTSLLDVGLPTASVAHYNDLAGVALQINRALPTGKRNPDEVMAEKFVSVVNRISDKVETQLFVKMELTKASGNLVKTNENILEVLGDLDVDEEGLQLVGHGALPVASV